MINGVIEAISRALNEEFADKEGLTVYAEDIEQDLTEPAFFIQLLNPSQDQQIGLRYLRRSPYCIQYFPSTEDYEAECNDVFERMTDCLEYITPTDETLPIRGTNMRSEITDGVLSFFVDYDEFLKKNPADVPIMEELELNGTPVSEN